MARQLPYSILGRVTVNSTNFEGATVLLWDMTKVNSEPVNLLNTTFDKTLNGEYILNLANAAIEGGYTYAHADKVKIQVLTPNGIYSSQIITTDTIAGFNIVNFTLTKKSGLVDGIKGEPDAPGSDARSGFGLSVGMTKGCVDGLQ